MANQISLPHAFDEMPWEPTLPPISTGSLSNLNDHNSSSKVDRLESNARMAMCMWFGFSPSPPLSTRSPIETEKDQQAFCHLLGWPWNMVKEHRSLFFRPFIAASAHFLECLSRQPSMIDPQDWDLNCFNYSCVVHQEKRRM